MRHAAVRRATRALALALACVALAGCERMFRDMYDQPKLKTATSSPLFADGLASRPPPPGSVAATLGTRAADSSGRRGADRVAMLDAADARQALPSHVDAALVARGHERYDIYCSPCHGTSGQGDGTIVRRGFPAPPSYRIERLRNAPDRHFFDVVTNGYGVMYPYADRVDASDRWAIVAYVRRLQDAGTASVAGAAAAPSGAIGKATR